jgi:hypothetical protein
MDDEIVRGPEPYPATVVAVEPLENYKLKVTLSDGRKGIFDVSRFIDMGDFRELKDQSYFRKVFVANDTVSWPHEQDIAPETIDYFLQPEPASV